MASWMAPYRFDQDPLCWPADGMYPDAAHLLRPLDGEPAFDCACDQVHQQTASSDPSLGASEVQRLGNMSLHSPRKPGTKKQRIVEAMSSIKATLRRSKREQQQQHPPEPSLSPALHHPAAAPGDRFVHGCCQDPFVPPAHAVHRRIRSEHDPWANAMPPWSDPAWLWGIDDPLMLPVDHYYSPAGLIMAPFPPHGVPAVAPPAVAPPAVAPPAVTAQEQLTQSQSLRPRPPRAPSSGARHRRVRDASPSSKTRGASSSPQPRRHASAGSISSVTSVMTPATPRGVRKRRSRDAGIAGGIAGAGGDEMGFVNFTPSDGEALMTGVAPSGSSKTKARREKEALERRRRLSEAAMKAVVAAGGDVDRLIQEGFEWRN